MDSKDRKKVREIRNIQFQMMEVEEWKRRSAILKEERLKNPDPKVVRDSNRRQILQTISKAWDYAKIYKQKNKAELSETENLKIKKTAILESSERLVELICYDVKNLPLELINETSVKNVLAYYTLQLEIIEKKAKEVGYNNILETINSKLLEELHLSNNLSDNL